MQLHLRCTLFTSRVPRSPLLPLLLWSLHDGEILWQSSYCSEETFFFPRRPVSSAQTNQVHWLVWVGILPISCSLKTCIFPGAPLLMELHFCASVEVGGWKQKVFALPPSTDLCQRRNIWQRLSALSDGRCVAANLSIAFALRRPSCGARFILFMLESAETSLEQREQQ